jgi:hypothetical protein
VAKTLRKTEQRLQSRINGWMASAKAQKDPRAYRRPGSMKHK